jgi:hypothetical protein
LFDIKKHTSKDSPIKYGPTKLKPLQEILKAVDRIKKGK